MKVNVEVVVRLDGDDNEEGDETLEATSSSERTEGKGKSTDNGN